MAAAVACDMLVVAVVVCFVSGKTVVACDVAMAADDSSVGGDAWMQLDFDWFDVQHGFAL